MSAHIINRTYPALSATAIAAVRRSGSATVITRVPNSFNGRHFSSTASAASPSSAQPSAAATGGAAPAAFWRRPRVWAVIGAVAAADAVLYWEYRGSRASAATPTATQ